MMNKTYGMYLQGIENEDICALYVENHFCGKDICWNIYEVFTKVCNTCFRTAQQVNTLMQVAANKAIFIP